MTIANETELSHHFSVVADQLHLTSEKHEEKEIKLSEQNKSNIKE